jgi:hypothetical protein
MLRQPLRRFAFIVVSDALVKFHSFSFGDWIVVDSFGFTFLVAGKGRVLFIGWPLLSIYFSCSHVPSLHRCALDSLPDWQSFGSNDPLWSLLPCPTVPRCAVSGTPFMTARIGGCPWNFWFQGLYPHLWWNHAP